MSEMIYEPPPGVHVPLVRDWFSPAVEQVTSALWGRRSTFVVWGIFFLFYAAWCFVKLMLWLGILTLMLVLFAFTATIDCITYRRRKRNAAVSAWVDYLEIGETP